MSLYWRGTANMVVEILPLNRAQVFAPLQFRGVRLIPKIRWSRHYLGIAESVWRRE
ncbi:MAG: hypothetical protein RID53_09770 [Coleofasciculus sp. B1-GNL1-01]|uniref:hypothetical protein n=1 Tax=Coleofasciculus sp. B1-GNL1-01 TaxID=3068484 RepID=UPI0032F4AE28